MLRVPVVRLDERLQLTRMSHYAFEAEVWEYPGPQAWNFVDVPVDIAEEIKAQYGARARGFGSLRVHVTLGASQWSTSVFPYREHGTYILPLKKPIRIAEGIADGDVVAVTLTVGA